MLSSYAQCSLVKENIKFEWNLSDSGKKLKRFWEDTWTSGDGLVYNDGDVKWLQANLFFFFLICFRIYARERRPGNYVVMSATVTVVSVSSDVYPGALAEYVSFDGECAFKLIRNSPLIVVSESRECVGNCLVVCLRSAVHFVNSTRNIQ